MAIITVKLAPPAVFEAMGKIAPENRYKLAWMMLEHYENQGHYRSEFNGIEGAREAFEISNSPAKYEERIALFGKTMRSISVGDVINVKDGNIGYGKGKDYFCDSVGWTLLE